MNKTIDGRLSFYELMDKLDEFCIDKADDYDFRELTLHTTMEDDKEFLIIKTKKGNTIKSICLS